MRGQLLRGGLLVRLRLLLLMWLPCCPSGGRWVRGDVERRRADGSAGASSQGAYALRIDATG